MIESRGDGMRRARRSLEQNEVLRLVDLQDELPQHVGQLPVVVRRGRALPAAVQRSARARVLSDSERRQVP